MKKPRSEAEDAARWVQRCIANALISHSLPVSFRMDLHLSQLAKGDRSAWECRKHGPFFRVLVPGTKRILGLSGSAVGAWKDAEAKARRRIIDIAASVYHWKHMVD